MILNNRKWRVRAMPSDPANGPPLHLRRVAAWRLPRRFVAANDNTPPIPVMAWRIVLLTAVLAGAVFALAG